MALKTGFVFYIAICVNLTHQETDGALDVMVCNPPFYPAPSGRVNSNTQKALARHEIGIELPELLTVVRSFLRKGGSVLSDLSGRPSGPLVGPFAENEPGAQNPSDDPFNSGCTGQINPGVRQSRSQSGISR